MPRRSTGTSPGLGRKPTTPQNPAGVRSEPPVSEPLASGTMEQASATRGAAAGPLRIEGIPRRPMHGIVGVGAGAELRHVGLSDDDGARPADGGDPALVLFRHVLRIDRRAEGGAQPRRQLQVLDGDRQAVEGPELIAPHHRLLGPSGLVLGAVPAGGGDGVEARVHRLGPRPAGGQQHGRRHALAGDEAAQFDRREIAALVHGGFPGGYYRKSRPPRSPGPTTRGVYPWGGWAGGAGWPGAPSFMMASIRLFGVAALELALGVRPAVPGAGGRGVNGGTVFRALGTVPAPAPGGRQGLVQAQAQAERRRC